MSRSPLQPPILAAAFALVLGACSDLPPTPGPFALDPLASISAAASPRFAEFAELTSPVSCAAPPATDDAFVTYQPFVLPSGYSQTILATERRDWIPLAGSGAGNPDMMVLNETGPQAGRYMYRTHEVGTNGAVTVTDLWTGETRLVSQESHYESLDGITWTPWGTLLFAEERIVASRRDPRVPDAVGGLVYEYDPATGSVEPRPAVGARSHEGLRVDAQGNLYGISESTPGSNGSGAIYKFVPDRRGDLSSGQLFALKVLDASRTGAAVWVPLDRQAVQVNSDAAAIAAGATGWGRPEDIEIATNVGNTRGGGIMYVASTSEDLVLQIELRGDEAFVSNFITPRSTFDSPDNLALDNQGNVWIAEDNSLGEIWMARPAVGGATSTPELSRFAILTDCSAEPTGIYFDRASRTLYVHVQHAGAPLNNDLFVAISKQ